MSYRQLTPPEGDNATVVMSCGDGEYQLEGRDDCGEGWIWKLDFDFVSPHQLLAILDDHMLSIDVRSVDSSLTEVQRRNRKARLHVIAALNVLRGHENYKVYDERSGEYIVV